MSTKKEPQLNFSAVWERITQRTEIKNQAQLADLIGIKPVNISKKKKADEFPVYWAYIVATEYGLSLDWLIKGEEQKESDKEKIPKNRYIVFLDEWLCEVTNEDPRKEHWFQCTIEENVPGFKEWLQRRKSATSQYRRIPETTA